MYIFPKYNIHTLLYISNSIYAIFYRNEIMPYRLLHGLHFSLYILSWWDLSSPTRDRTRVPCIGPPGKSQAFHILKAVV